MPTSQFTGTGSLRCSSAPLKGGATQEIESNVSAPKRVEIEKSSEHFSMWIGSVPRELEFAGALTSVALTAPFYVGIGVSAHDKNAIQSMVFANVELTSPDRSKRGVTRTFSTITTINVRSSDARVSYVAPDKIDSAEWSADGKSLVYSAARQVDDYPRIALRRADPGNFTGHFKSC